MRAIQSVLSFLCASLLSTSAFAHISLSSPTARQNAELKDGPCGNGADEDRSENITTFSPGETITVKWKEVVDHDSHYVISFSANGTEDFVNPTNKDDKARTELPVLVDGIEDKNGGDYEATVTLPMEECDNCTLQLIQIMYDRDWAGAFYYQCADIMIVDDGTIDPDGTGGADPAGAGGSDATGEASERGAGGGNPAGDADGLGTGGTDASSGGAMATGGADLGSGASAASATTGGTSALASTGGATSTVAPAGAQDDEESVPGDEEGGCSLGGPSRGVSLCFVFALPLLALRRRRFASSI